MTTYDDTISELKGSISKSIKKNKFGEHELDSQITANDTGFGDISCSVAFKISKMEKKSPQIIAEMLVKGIKKPKNVKAVKAEGGFINFYLDRKVFSEDAIGYVLQSEEDSLSSTSGKNSRVIIESPGVNPNKPWHIGHLRNALLGNTISNIYGACGYLVEREDYIDDMGLQVVELLFGYMKDPEIESGKKFDHAMGELYVKVNKQIEGNKGLAATLTGLLSAMERGGTTESKVARGMTEKCVAAQYQTAFDYRIYHDVLVWESDIVHSKMLDKALRMLGKTGAVRKEEHDEKYKGCLIMDFTKVKDLPSGFEGLKEPIKVLVRSNGTATYAAKDIAFHMWKFGLLEDPFLYSAFMEKQPNGKKLYTTSEKGERMSFGGVKRAINIIGSEQAYEQEVVKIAFRLMGRDDMADNLVHLGYGFVDSEAGAFSGRKGTEGYTADDLLREAREKALGLITKRLKLSAKEKEQVAEIVALAAIKFEFLRVSPERKIIFSWDKALNFEGISGPYCQYTHARAERIIEKSGIGKQKILREDLKALVGDEEFRLVKLISKSSSMVEKACREHRTNVLTDYAGELASVFSKFYEKVPVLKTEDASELRARLALVYSFKYTMGGILSLLGIDAPKKM